MNTATQLALFDAPTLEVQPTKTLDSILECLDSVPYINSGGCGISALAIYRWCKKNGVEVSDRPFWFVSWDDDFIPQNEEWCDEGQFDILRVPHIVIEVDGTPIDSTGNPDFIFVQPYKLNEEELLIRINNVERWNTSFNRNKYRDIIALGLDVDLSDVNLADSN